VLGAAGAAIGPASFVWGSEGRTGRFAGESASSEEIDVRTCAVGYWTGSEECADLAAFLAGELSPLRADIIPAEALPSGDPGFLRTGAYVTIHGLTTAQRSLLRPELSGLSVQIPFRYIDRGVERTATCAAWNYSSAPVANRSAAAGMLVPVECDTGLRFFVEEQANEPGLLRRTFDAAVLGRSAGENGPTVGRRGEVRFMIGREAGVPKLRRGIYAVALPGRHGWTQPAWRHYQVLDTPDEPQPRGLRRQAPLGPEPADFDYLLISIEAGRPAVGIPPEA
jgi:hypothetical protein